MAAAVSLPPPKIPTTWSFIRSNRTGAFRARRRGLPLPVPFFFALPGYHFVRAVVPVEDLHRAVLGDRVSEVLSDVGEREIARQYGPLPVIDIGIVVDSSFCRPEVVQLLLKVLHP